jgi:ribosome-associated heat shock protein Hsp15
VRRPAANDDEPPADTQRLDKWLWFARVIKSRTAAADLVAGGKVRINRQKTAKPSATVRVGDVITVVAHHRLRVLEVKGLGERRGSAPEAAELFHERPSSPIPTEQGCDDAET